MTIGGRTHHTKVYILKISEIDGMAVIEILGDLEVQAMIFDMEIDYEALTVTPKVEPQPFWITRWKEKQENGDRQPSDYEGE